MDYTDIDSEDIDTLVDAIKEENCIVFLGPRLTETGESLQTNFLSQIYNTSKLNRNSADDIIAFHQTDSLLLFRKNKNKYALRINKFYNQIFAKNTLTMLAQIPIPVFVLLTPDLSLRKVFDELKLPYQYEFYDTHVQKELEKKPTGKEPLIYSFFGTSTDSNTIIVTHSDLFNYLRAIFGGIKLPILLNEKLRNAHHILFLGCELDKWYVQILLNVLDWELERNVEDITKYAPYSDLQPDDEILCSDHLHIQFISNKTHEFVESIFKTYETIGELNKSVTSPPSQKFNIAAIRNFIEQAFSSTELVSFCMDNFYEAYNQFGDGQSKPQQITLLLDYLLRNQLIPVFLELAQKNNPAQFTVCGPFHE